MATIHVRNVPDPFYERITKLARDENRSISAEVVRLIELGMADRLRMDDQREMLAEFRRNPIRLPEGAPMPEDLIREDRDR